MVFFKKIIVSCESTTENQRLFCPIQDDYRRLHFSGVMKFILSLQVFSINK